MLKSLQVRNFVLIDSLDISFPAGLSIISGQTGAGKSILLGAVSLVLGSRADSSMVGEGGDSCVVEAEFETGDDAVRSIIDSEDLDWNDGRLVIRRVLNRSGRSRSFVNDEPVQVALLSRIASRLIDIHSQHQNLLLSDKKYQLSLLDYYAGNRELLAKYRILYSDLAADEKKAAAMSAEIEELGRQKDYNESRLAQLEAAKLRDGELEEIEEEQKNLANAEEIRDSLYTAENLLDPGEEESGRESVDSSLKEAAKLLEKAGRFVSSASDLSKRLESARFEIDDILDSLRTLEAGVVISPERLAAVEARMALLYDLKSKFRCPDIPSLIKERDRLSSMVLGGEELEEKLRKLNEKIDADRMKLRELADELHESRASAAPAFSSAVQDLIRSLELGQAVFSVSLSEGELSSDGRDSVSFLFSAAGRNPADVSKCASGGEISRIMLCLKFMMARYTAMPTMIFDEIDTGVSGSVADKMGSMICRMGEYMQVFAITHLPQVAAKGNAHYLVSKDISDGRAATSIREISGDERVMEIARMLSGSSISPEAVANAKALLKS